MLSDDLDVPELFLVGVTFGLLVSGLLLLLIHAVLG
jgi:hypothetical protein